MVKWYITDTGYDWRGIVHSVFFCLRFIKKFSGLDQAYTTSSVFIRIGHMSNTLKLLLS